MLRPEIFQNPFLCAVQVDYLIIGQGICGTLLSYCLQKAGKKVLVIDEARPDASSRVASGIINPITGKRLVKTWMADQLIPAATTMYRAMEEMLGTAVLSEYDLLDFHLTEQEHALFLERMEEDDTYLHLPAVEKWDPYFYRHAGLGSIAPCWLVELPVLLPAWRKWLQAHGALLEERFDWAHCDVRPERVTYKDIVAEKVIACEGPAGFDNPYFSRLPYSRNKGEAVLVAVPDLPRTHLFRQGYKVVPWQQELFWVGASFEWDFTEPGPTAAFLAAVRHRLDQWLKLPYRIEAHWAAERPATVGHRPFAGLHPLHPAVGVLNGTGTKGCSLAPYLAQQFCDHLLQGTSILPDADVQRFTRILSR